MLIFFIHDLWTSDLDDVVLDDIYQYHLPPTRRVPPLLWARIRSYASVLSFSINIQFLNWQVRAPWLPDWHRGGRGDGDQLETSAVQVREMNWWAYKLMNSVFREAAKTRYLSQESDCQYFHNIMSEYFLGTFGNGKPKPFKFTEIQRHRFGLKSKDAAEDRQVNSSSSNLWDRIFIFSQRCQTCHLCFPLLRKMSKDSTWGSWAS